MILFSTLADRNPDLSIFPSLFFQVFLKILKFSWKKAYSETVLFSQDNMSNIPSIGK